MKRNYIICLFALAVLAVPGCKDVKESAEQPLEWDQKLVFTATREGVDSDTKTVRMSGGETWWSPEEEISLFYGAGTAGGSKFVSQNETIAKTATFSGALQMSGSDKDFWAVYPYSVENECDGESVITVIPDVQHAVKGNFSDNVFPSLARSKNKSLSFWNICGGVKFSVSRSDIKSITFQSNNNEYLAGKVQIFYSESVGYGFIDGKSSVTVSAPDGGTFVAGKYYYISLLPTVLSQGFTMTFVTENQKGTLCSNKAQTIKRSTFGVLSSIDSAVSNWQDLPKPIQSISIYPEAYYEGAPWVRLWEFIGPKLSSSYPYLTQLTYPEQGSFICSSPCTFSFIINPQTANVEDYDWSFINRIAPNGSEKTDLVSIINGPVKHGNRYHFSILTNKALKEGTVENQIALRAQSKERNNAGQYDVCTSDYAYISGEKIISYSIIDKEKYKNAPAAIQPFRTDFIDINDTYDIMMPYNEITDIAYYIDTFADQAGRTVTDLGITPQYELWFAGRNDSNVCISKNPSEAPYYDGTSYTNQNQFIRIDGTAIRVDDAFVSTLLPAVGRTPLIYVRATYNGRPLADCFIKLYIVKEADPEPEPLPWDVFIKHDVVFDYDNLSATGTHTGTSGMLTAPRNGSNTTNRDLLVNWDELNRYVLNDSSIAMSYEDFTNKYDVDNLKLILTNQGKVPGSSLPDRDHSMLVDLSEIATYYGSGVSISAQSSSSWNAGPFPLSLEINKAIQSFNKQYYVYVLIPAKDNTKYIDVVLAFSFKVNPHQHSPTIFDWRLNPDRLIGAADKLVKTKPSGNYSFDNYGAISAQISSQGATSSLLEHFRDYGANNNIQLSSESATTYSFVIKNYTTDRVAFTTTNAGTVSTEFSSGKYYSKVTLTSAEFKGIINGIYSAPVLMLKDTGYTSDDVEILIEVSEQCGITGTKFSGYYFVVFEAPLKKASIDFNTIELGTFPSYNDYALAHEIIKGIYDAPAGQAYRHLLFQWDNGSWQATSIAQALYGFSPYDTNLKVKVSGLVFGDDKDSAGNPVLSEEELAAMTSPDYDTRASFGGRLFAFDAGDSLSPIPNGAMTESGVNWWNNGSNQMRNKEAYLTVTVEYNSGYKYVKLCEGRVKLTVLASGGKTHPYHKTDGSLWE